MKRMILMVLVLVFAFSTYIFSYASAEDGIESKENEYSIECQLCEWNETEKIPTKCIILENASTTSVEKSRVIIISAIPSDQVKKIYFIWDDSDTMYETLNSQLKLSFPEEFEIGSIHTLYVRVRYDDDELGEREEFKFSFIDGPDDVFEELIDDN